MRIGITGHMDLTGDTNALIAEAITTRLADLDDGHLVGISCIARGADSIFAQAILDRGATLTVVLPSHTYRQTTVKPDHAAQFDEFVRRAAEVAVMPFDMAGRDAYEAANSAVLESCDRLIAVWDGTDGEQSGTGSVVKLAGEQQLPVDVIWPDGAQRM